MQTLNEENLNNARGLSYRDREKVYLRNVYTEK